MSTIILATDSRSLSRSIRLAGSDDELMVIARDQIPAGAAQLLALANAPEEVRTVILDGGGDPETEARVLQLSSRMQQSHPQVSIVLVTPRGEEIALRALRSGVRDVLPTEAPVEDVRWVLRRAAESAQAFATGHALGDTFTGRVIAVASPKGGVGKTTIATHLAAVLAQHSPTGTVLVDLDVQFGDVAAALDLEPTYTLGDVLSGPVSTDAIALKSLLTQHASGLYVLPGVRNPAEADNIGTGNISRLLGTLKREFRYVVLDTAPGLHEQTLAALDQATDVVLVCGLDVPSLRGMRKELEVLEELDLEPLNIHVVVNMADKTGGLSVADVAATLGRKVDVVLPRSGKLLRATNAGEPLVLSNPRDPVSKDLSALAGRFAPLGVGRAGRQQRGRRSR
ncbi:AAA family ATPase [Ornithinimicrobium sp. W1665]|uniref:AAA family ATPase n=1 Tax=Ornithinimicrobium sp. W1665 TaxID=3416666 RepID=UPI003CF6A2F6